MAQRLLLRALAFPAVMLFASLMLAGTPDVQAAEEILSYHSDIIVQKDGALDITETIRVKAEGRSIRRGIFRDFPTRYEDRHGNAISVGFDVLSVSRNGAPERFSVEDFINGKRVRIGRADSILAKDIHTYVIRYKTTWQISHFEGVDELYFNAIGTGWQFPILEGSARVQLPEGAEISRQTAYTGAQGAQGSSYGAKRESANSVLFETTDVLPPRSGLTIVVEWPAGFVVRPTAGERAARFLELNAWIFTGVIGAIIVVLYWFGAWRVVGRDFKRGTIIARYAPPEGPDGKLSPGLCRFIAKKGVDTTGFSAAIISMASKGFLSMKESGNTLTLVREMEDDSVLSAGEQSIAARFFYYVGDQFHIEGKYNENLAKALQAFGDVLSKDEGRYFDLNIAPTAVGFSLWLSSVLIMVMTAGNALFGLIGLLALGGLAYWAIVAFQAPKFHESRGVVTAAAVALPIFVAFGAAWFWALPSGILLFALSAVGSLVVSLVFMPLMGRHTLYGRGLLDEIEGFKLYLGVAEKDRLNFHNPPERTPELFEAYLPYAIALGVENDWGRQFESVLAEAAHARGDKTYQPVWYSGTGRGWHFSSGGRFSSTAFAGAISSTVTSSIASASTPPASSGNSGFSGGGFSGGGGGGGGGGGW